MKRCSRTATRTTGEHKAAADMACCIRLQPRHDMAYCMRLQLRLGMACCMRLLCTHVLHPGSRLFRSSKGTAETQPTKTMPAASENVANWLWAWPWGLVGCVGTAELKAAAAEKTVCTFLLREGVVEGSGRTSEERREDRFRKLHARSPTRHGACC